ncbi:membrane protein [Streptomyces formicae]|uniref:Membrane protein n=1 Tax=Streptomyces formicae TaxID=1616117 RepID=A0A291QDL9_9ACTN|nr:membrane protein [Streptomyces formicae]
MAAMQLTRTHRILIGVVVAGAVVIAGIGFAGSYAAVRELAEKKGFGGFSVVFPIGIDAGICVLLALDLLLTWIRIPFPLLRQTAWLLTAATIAFNGAAAWPDPLGVGMHAVIPVLFVVAVEAARHAVGRIADITADKHMEGVRLTRWLLSPVPTFKLWRRMKLWELRSYEQVIKLEQDRLVYQARLQARFGRSWRRKAPVESLMPLRLARFGVPLAETAPAGLAAAGIEPVLLPPAPKAVEPTPQPQLTPAPTPPAPNPPSPSPSPKPRPSRPRRSRWPSTRARGSRRTTPRTSPWSRTTSGTPNRNASSRDSPRSRSSPRDRNSPRNTRSPRRSSRSRPARAAPAPSATALRTPSPSPSPSPRPSPRPPPRTTSSTRCSATR